MDKLYVVIVYDNVIRSTLAELAWRTDATYWLIASPRYLRKLSAQHTVVFSRVLQQTDFSLPGLIARFGSELGDARPERLRFLTNDESCEVACLKLQQRFGTRVWSLDQVLPCVNKVASKRRLAGTDVCLPRYVPFDKKRYQTEQSAYFGQIAEYVGFPMIVKPVDSYASMNVRRLDCRADFQAWATVSSSIQDPNTYEIEEFIDGVLFNCDSLIQEGRVIWSHVCRNVNPCLHFAAGRSIGIYTIPSDHEDAARVGELNSRVLAALEPPDGAVHLECFLRPSGEPVFLELSARPPGGDMVGVYRRCFDFDLDVAHFALRAREPYLLEAQPSGSYGGWAIHPKRKGEVRRVHMPPLRSENRVRVNVAVGDVVEADSRHIVDEPAAEFWFFSNDYGNIEHDAALLRDLDLCGVGE